MRPPRPGSPARNWSLGPIWVCDVGPPITIGWVGDQEPSELLKNSLQFGSAIAGDVPASVAATPPMTTTTANPHLVARPRFTVAPHEIHGRYRCTVKLMRISGSGASNEDTLTEQHLESVQALSPD